MISLTRLRQAIRDNIARSLSDQGRPTVWKGQAKNGVTTHEVVQRPSLYIPPLQVLDPDDPDFGRFYYMVDYDPPGNPDNLPIR